MITRSVLCFMATCVECFCRQRTSCGFVVAKQTPVWTNGGTHVWIGEGFSGSDNRLHPQARSQRSHAASGAHRSEAMSDAGSSSRHNTAGKDACGAAVPDDRLLNAHARSPLPESAGSSEVSPRDELCAARMAWSRQMVHIAVTGLLLFDGLRLCELLRSRALDGLRAGGEGGDGELHGRAQCARRRADGRSVHRRCDGVRTNCSS